MPFPAKTDAKTDFTPTRLNNPAGYYHIYHLLSLTPMIAIRITLTMLIWMISTFIAYAQNFTDVLRTQVQAFEEAKDLAGKTAVSKQLETLVASYPNEWAASYYAAYSTIVIAFFEPGATKKDQLLDQAEKYLAQARKLAPRNDEIPVVAALGASARMSVDPETRWQQYGTVYEENLQQAKSLRPENPRIYYLQGLSAMYTPEMYGGGKRAALPHFEKADSLFGKETEKDIRKPFWGKADNASHLAQCREAANHKP
jgi:hypothetical protein